VCSGFCDDWFAACKNDYTCVSDWRNDFVYDGRSYTCPLGYSCRTFQQRYGNGTNMCNTMWGTSFAASKLVMHDLPPLLAQSVRFLIAGIGLMAVARWRGSRIPFILKEWQHFAVMGFFLVMAASGLNALAIRYVSSSESALLNVSAAFWIPLLGTLGKRGHPLSARSGDPGIRALLCIVGLQQDGAIALGGGEGQIHRAWQLGQFRLRGQIAWSLTNIGRIGSAAGGELGFSCCQKRLRSGISRRGLIDISLGNFAHIKPGLGLIELALEHGDVFLANLQAFAIATHINIGLDNRLHHTGLDTAQTLAGGQHLGLGHAQSPGCATARIDRL
jgi:hypothetical protein